MLQLWLIAVSIVGVALLLAIAITTLRGQADSARLEQITAARIDADAERISRLEGQAEALGRLTPDMKVEFELAHGRIDELLHRFDPDDQDVARRLHDEAHVFIGAVKKHLRLLEEGRISESQTIDEGEVEPTFMRLQGLLRSIDAAQSQAAEDATARADLGIIASLLVGALALVLMLWRLDTLRGRAVRTRQQDLEALALQDPLTGLPNRRRLVIDLGRELGHESAEGRCVLLLCDLDGFKTYNDTFGHLEGDLLLSRLGERLAGAVGPRGTAYRLGGDEFCALIRLEDSEVGTVLEACQSALSESGSGFEIRSSIGAVKLPEEAQDPMSALRLADQRMYAQKNGRGSSVTQQLRDLIMRVLVEHDPALRHHGQDVALRAGAVGRRIGLNASPLADLVRATELRDVGKVAIPDSILQKPGPLDARERQFIQRHTLIGESILSAAPALARVARLVRSSHENYDGTGYPDGLRKEEIPLRSRIIFVCDSFDTMTTERPYGLAMSESEALAELARCAGTQFDPAVVAAFAAEHERHTAEPLLQGGARA